MVQVWPRDPEALAAFWRFYEPRAFALIARVRAAIRELPGWSAAVSFSAEEAAALDQRTVTLQRAAFVDGDWEPLMADLRARGVQYARSGVTFRAWFALIRLMREVMGAAIIEAQPSDPLEITRGLGTFTDLLAEQIGESFLSTTEQQLTGSESRFRAMFDQSPMPMWMFDRDTLAFVTINEAEVRFDQALDQLWMAFQPIVHAKTGLPYGVEALVRSREPSMATPQALLDAATQLARLPVLGRKVRALSAAALAGRSDQLALFVNLHPEDLADVDLLSETAPLTQLAPRVILEVTERASLGSSRELTARLARLRALGFRLAVDDIGAGYSGLTSFTELVPEIVKIDMSLVRDIHQSALKQRTVAALCRLCRECGSLVVGEGVETRDERECLVALGCDLLQGYLLGRPSATLPG